MMELDATETFRQEVADLLESLESSLLDLGQTPGDRDLVDTAFRALHTIKGSGAMFGFDRVAAFAHDFETAFDLIRKGKIDANPDIVGVALAAKDYIRMLIDDPDGADPIIGEAIVEELKRFIDVPGGAPAVAAAQPARPGSPTRIGWRLAIAFQSDVLRNGANPLVLLDDLRALGRCEIVADSRRGPGPRDPRSRACLIKWRVALFGDCELDAIEDVFMFMRDEMTLEVVPLQPAEPAPRPAGPEASLPPAAEAPARAPAAAIEAPAPDGPNRRGAATTRPRRFAFRPNGSTN